MFLRKNNTVKWRLLLITLIATIVLALLGIFIFDKPLFLFFRGFDNSVWVIFERVFATKIWLGTFGILFTLNLIKNTLNTKSKHKENKNKFNLKLKIKEIIVISKTNYSFLILCSILSSAIITGVLKFIIGRSRPVFFEALGRTGFLPWTHDWAFNSMPSGHTSASFAGFVMLGLLFPKYKWATWMAAILIGLSRIAIGAHFPSDVLVGAFIGMATADLIKYSFFKKIK